VVADYETINDYGGTGGHIFPGLAIAQTMRARGWEVSWLGTSTGMEQDLVPKSGIAMDSINFTGMRGKGLKHTVSGAFKMVKRLPTASALSAPQAGRGDGHGRLCDRAGRPDGAPARHAAGAGECRRGAAAVEQDAGASGFARVLRFPANFGNAASKAVVTGNPVRKEILDMAPPAQRFAGREGPLRILVVGGSLVRALNDALPAALALIPKRSVRR
jgi:UDP-N-acetylglucosamine--N-acetylmuramyl-(pentapeptide) pyrophosphoryl-undecaprenol N-acetylglucosamine transferase